MSNNEIGQIKGTVYQASAGKDPTNVAAALAFTIAANGTVTLLIGSVTTPFTQNSRILGVVRTAVAGGATVATTPVMVTVLPFGVDAAGKVAAVAGGYSSLTLQSSLVADTSSFTIYWYNETGANLLIC